MVLFGITEIQCSYYLNKFSCHFHSRLSFLFTIGDVQLSIKNDYLHSWLWRKKSTERTCHRVGGKAGSWTWVCSLQETIPVTEILAAWAFSLSFPLPLPFPSPSAATTNSPYKIIFLKKHDWFNWLTCMYLNGLFFFFLSSAKNFQFFGYCIQ